ncbi:GIY-YIG nuclease family protein [Shewanella sp. 10N.286.55.A9]|uniref:GIY-YIG nuclease family protein n=1 Tax=Shewanella sp. 10N.286.55.A9 TaxID=3229720 RepID=UPI0035511A3C
MSRKNTLDLIEKHHFEIAKKKNKAKFDRLAELELTAMRNKEPFQEKTKSPKEIRKKIEAHQRKISNNKRFSERDRLVELELEAMRNESEPLQISKIPIVVESIETTKATLDRSIPELIVQALPQAEQVVTRTYTKKVSHVSPINAAEGYVYCLRSTFTKLVKIGFTTQTPQARCAELNEHGGTALPSQWILAWSEHCQYPYHKEQEMHKIFDHVRHNRSREFFNVDAVVAHSKFKALYK